MICNEEERDKRKSYFNRHKFKLKEDSKAISNMPENIYKYGRADRIRVKDARGLLSCGTVVMLSPHIAHVEKESNKMIHREDKEDFETDVFVITADKKHFRYRVNNFSEYMMWLLDVETFENIEEINCILIEWDKTESKDQWEYHGKDEEEAYTQWNYYCIMDDEYPEEIGIYEGYNMYDAYINYCKVFRRYGEVDREMGHISMIEEIPYSIESYYTYTYKVDRAGEIELNDEIAKRFIKYGLYRYEWREDERLSREMRRRIEEMRREREEEIESKEIYIKKRGVLTKVDTIDVDAIEKYTLEKEADPRRIIEYEI